MKMLTTLIAGTALALGASAAVAKAPSGEETLARMLAGRVAGQPVRCIALFRSDQLRVIDRVGVVYDAGKTIYVARARDPQSLRDDDILVTDRFGSQFCREDSMHTVERYTGALKSVVFLDDFVPYTRAG